MENTKILMAIQERALLMLVSSFTIGVDQGLIDSGVTNRGDKCIWREGDGKMSWLLCIKWLQFVSFSRPYGPAQRLNSNVGSDFGVR